MIFHEDVLAHTPKPCACCKFFASPPVQCRFAKHPDPALCGVTDRNPHPDESDRWIMDMFDIYGSMWDGD